MTKFFIGLQISFWLGFVLFDTTAGIEFQMAFVAGYAIVKLVPGRVWLAIGEGLAEMMPWIMIANIDL
jgi:hypothetical protein